MKQSSFQTLLQHLGDDPRPMRSVTPPIFQTSLFTFEDHEQILAAQADPGGAPYVYSRIGNPTLEPAEAKIAAMEGAEKARLVSSGMAAIQIAIQSCVTKGSHVVAVDSCYGPTRRYLLDVLAPLGIKTTFVEGSDPQEFEQALRPETSLIYLESPSSLLFRLQDIVAVTSLAAAKGIPTIIDNTWATPLFQQPMAMGVDLVVHSASKYLGGHSDIVAGVICGNAERMAAIQFREIDLSGAILSPFPAWLLNRGLRTLALRMKAHEATGHEIAAWLEAQPSCKTMNHPGRASHPQHVLYQKQCSGSSGLFSFVPTFQSRESMLAFCHALQLFQVGVSWGGYESLALPISVLPFEAHEPHWVIRISCGLEEPEELIADLSNALATAQS